MRVVVPDPPLPARLVRREVRRVIVGGEFGNEPGTHLAQATDAMHRIAGAAGQAGQLALLDFRGLTGRCFAAEFELAAQLTTWRIPPGTRVAVLDHPQNQRLWDRWSAIALEQRRCIEAFTMAQEALGWLAE